MTQATKVNYKQTLNLPKTDFPMRANLVQNEAASLKRWSSMNLYESVVEKRSGAEPFIFHDGPPYANGQLHTGHLLNKVLKDIVVRSRLMAGMHCPYVPGWDCHGLPIEHQVMTDMMKTGKIEKLNSLTEDHRRMAVRRECKKHAEKFIKIQSDQMKRMLTLADYDNPYITMDPLYEQAVLEVFAILFEQELVYRALKPVHWSIANQTALAEAELEYEDREDLSVYVNFDAVDSSALCKAFGVKQDSGGRGGAFMIWTTTPWTLPANLAIAVHEKFRYSLVKVNGCVTVIASDLVEQVSKAGKAKSVEVFGETEGKNLLGLEYKHPFCNRTGRVIAAEYVTLEDGTGLVHTAPGHGAEDFYTGQREGLEIYCPVQGDGTFDDTVPGWLSGLSVWDANEKITDHLRNSGHLFFSHTFTHSYPHDWRSKTPVVFRSTKQWFISVDTQTIETKKSLRELGLNATDNEVAFVPQWGKNRMRGMLESRPDWCISRQRAWGLPIPAFQLPNGDVFMTAASVRAVAEAFGKRGSDAWFTESQETLLETYDATNDPDAPADLKSQISNLRKMYDIFDVWFESGSSWNGVLNVRKLGYPADLYLEGSDQHRGWFQLSLLPALGATGQSPFKTLLTHGFTVDKDGKKMSKSLGNTMEVEDMLKEFGGDVCRWWVSSLAYENDIRMDVEFLKVAGETYRKVRNTLRFLLSNLFDFELKSHGIDLKTLSPTSLDAYLLSEANRIQNVIRTAYEKYEFRRVHQNLYDFCNESLSAFYCAAVKDRLYCDKPDSLRRRATQTAMWHVLEMLTRLLAPILPHTADEAYRALLKSEEGCVQCETYYAMPDVDIDPDWNTFFDSLEYVLKALEDAKERGIENPLDAEVVLPDPEGKLKKFQADMADAFGVSRVQLVADGEITVNDLRDEPRCDRSWKRDGSVKQRSDGGMLSDRDADAVGV